jgi:serine/threonine protein kinase
METEFFRELQVSLDEARYPEELTNACELMECLSHGEGCETLLARCRGTGALYVVKCYETGHPLFFATEPEALRCLNHHGLPSFIAEYKSETMRCILREYIEGETLEHAVVHSQPTEETVRSIGIGLCDILTYLHGQTPPIIHRDIKPQNVVLGEDGKVSLIDFGISRLYVEDEKTDTVAFGTKTFSPPEQYGFSQTDCRSDIFSLGVLLHWLLTGNTELEKLGTSPLEKVAASCTAFDPQNRYKDATVVRRALCRSEPKNRKRRARRVTASALVVLAAAIAAVIWWGNYQPLNDPSHTPAFITSKNLQTESAAYLNERYQTDLFEASDTTGDVGYIRTLLVEVFGYEHDYAYAMPPATPPAEVEESFLPWAFEDNETLSRDMTVYMVVKIFWPDIVGDWSSLKDDTGEYPGIRVSVPFAEKASVLDGLNRPDHLTRGDIAVLFANASRAYGDELPPQLAAVDGKAVSNGVSASGFSEPLMEKAVRLILNTSEDAPLSEAELASVTELYIVADKALPTMEAFYAAINDWDSSENTSCGTIQTLEDVVLLPNLKTVCIAAQQITDLSPLSGLTALEKVELKHNAVRDVSALAGLEHLVSVGLNDNPVTDLTPLTKCPNLRFLDLCDIQNYDPSFLDSMGDFEFLDVSNTTDSYLHLAGKRIGELKLCWTRMTTLNCLDEVYGLECLEISNTAVTDLSPLAAHPELRSLRLSGLAASDLSVLLTLPELESVTVSRDMEPAVAALGDDVPFQITYE